MRTSLSVARLPSLDFEPIGKSVDCSRGSLVNETKEWRDNRPPNHRRQHADLERNILDVLTPLLTDGEGLALTAEQVRCAVAQPGRVLLRVERLCLHLNQSKVTAPFLNDVSAGKTVSRKECRLKDSDAFVLERFPSGGGSHKWIAAVLERDPLRVVELRQRLNHVAAFGEHAEIVVVLLCIWIAKFTIVKLCLARARYFEIGFGERLEAILSRHHPSPCDSRGALTTQKPLLACILSQLIRGAEANALGVP